MDQDKVVRVTSIDELMAALDKEASALLKGCQRKSGTAPFALKRAVDASLPPLTGVVAGLPNSQIAKTNPPQPPSVESGAASADVRSSPLTVVDVGLPNSQMHGTNPPITAEGTSGAAMEGIDLSPRQLAAARMLAR